MNTLLICAAAALTAIAPAAASDVSVKQPVHPLLTLREHCQVMRIVVRGDQTSAQRLTSAEFSLEGSTTPGDIVSASLFAGEKPKTARYTWAVPDSLIATTKPHGTTVRFALDHRLNADSTVLWLTLRLADTAASPSARVQVSPIAIDIDHKPVGLPDFRPLKFRTGVALRQPGDDGVHTSRIPGLITTREGTLIAMYDARNETDDDLQGDIDIAINRSTDGGQTWQPIQRVIDLGTYGGLPQRYNGVSDGCIMTDDSNGDIYVAGLWMHGVIDPASGRWLTGITDTTSVWNHQWRSGSKAGYELSETSQFMISRSSDDGLTWSSPRNITRDIKQRDWWLIAPAPGRGITLADGTLAMPVEGRNETGRQFSTIMTSSNHGENWTIGTPAFYNVNECQIVQLGNGSIMLNARKRDNRGKVEGNGRVVCITTDLGQSWTEHPTSRCALIEPACQGGLHRHDYTRHGEKRHLLIFTNPSHNARRIHHTLKVSFDDGETWPQDYWIELDDDFGAGYSCITSIDEDTIGIFYEGSQADLQFQAIPLSDILHE